MIGSGGGNLPIDLLALRWRQAQACLESQAALTRKGAVTIAEVDGFDRNRLVQLADRLPEEAIPAATRYLEYLADRGDPFVRHLLEAPEEEEDLSEAGRRLLRDAYDDIDAGRLWGSDELRREFGLRSGLFSIPAVRSKT